MNLRTLALAIGTCTIAACSKDSKPMADVLAEDSTLALEVMSAHGDSLIQESDTATTVATTPPDIAPPAASEPQPKSAPKLAESRTETPPIRRTRTQSRRVTVSNVVRRTPRNPVSRAAVEESRKSNRTPMRASASIPAGTELSLNAGQRICTSMSRVGDTFTATLADDLVGPIGVVIPKGTVATASIASLGKNLDLDVRSLAFAGHTYSIASDVTYTEVERVKRKSTASRNRIAAGAGIGAVAGGVLGGNPATTVLGAAAGGVAGAVTSKRSVRDDACIPEGGRITVKLVDPLKLALTE